MLVDNNKCFKLMLFVHIASTVVGVTQIAIEVGRWLSRTGHVSLVS